MLSFKIIQFGSVPAICIDEHGLAALIKRVEAARSQGHVHLRTPGNGGLDLDETTPFGTAAIGEVIIDWVGEE